MPTQTLADAIDTIREYTPNRLAGEAECACPDSPTSPGAEFLTSVRDSVIEFLEDDPATALSEEPDYNGRVHEIADAAPSVYTHERWQQFVDLGAYAEDLDALGTGDMESDAGAALYLIAERLASSLLATVHEMIED